MFFILQCIYFLLPAGLANMAPSLMKYCFSGLAKPIDNNKTWQGKPIFGDHKTWRGPVFSPIFSLIIFGMQKYLYQFPSFQEISWFDYNQYPIWLGLLFGLGVVFGELINSFIKRRINFPPGKSFIPFDQIDFTVGSLFLVSFFIWPGWLKALSIILIGFFLHILFNLIGYLLKTKKNKL